MIGITKYRTSCILPRNRCILEVETGSQKIKIIKIKEDDTFREVK